jgi:O-antigen ligase
MTATNSKSCRYALGVALFACLVLGGGTASGLPVDAVLQILVILCSTYVLLRRWDAPISRAGLVFFGLVLCAGLIQIVPLPIDLFRPFRPEVFLPFLPGASTEPVTTTISLAASQTVLSTIFALVPIYFFLAMSRLSSADLIGLIPFYIIGVLCNLAAAVFQYSLSPGAAANDLLGYRIAAGMFANVNHFSTLLFISIPIIIYLGIFLNRRAFAVTALLLIALTLLAAGSRAGILIGLAISVITVVSLAWRARKGGILALALMLLLAIYSYGTIVQIGEQSMADQEFGRRYFALATLEGIRENWLFGVGYGAFETAFQHYEYQDALQVYYVNHAHNDFLEVAFEGGVLGMLILGLYVLALLWRTLQIGSLPLQRLASLSILMVLVHATVDYPLRTMAVAMVFAFFNALLFSDAMPELSPSGRKRGRSVASGASIGRSRSRRRIRDGKITEPHH